MTWAYIQTGLRSLNAIFRCILQIRKTLLIKIFVLTEPIIHSIFFVVGNIVFMHAQTPVHNLVFSSSDAVDCYVFGLLARSMNVSAMIIDKGNAKYPE